MDMRSDSHDSPNGDRPVIGITMGDPAGIGAECIVKALADHSLRERARYLIYGLHEPISYAADMAELTPYWTRVPQEDARRMYRVAAVGRSGESSSSDNPIDPQEDSSVLLADFDDLSVEGRPLRKPTAESGRASLRFLEEAVSDARTGRISAIVTGPINKTAWNMAGAPFVGHTEFLAKRFNARRVTMMFAGGPLKVALASIHEPLFELRHSFTIGLVFQPIDLMHEALRDWFGIPSPKIAVAALNPHAGENGQIGDEEIRVIEPAIEMARNHGIDARGPYPADTLFWRAAQGEFDGVVAMYHDQALIPVKLLAFDRAVNLTLGLPIIRTSVDHGTAYDIAGKNLADPGSMKAAIRLAIELTSKR
jgi:4-hydroxythreonine-4-phosphate dehydrogenase